MVWVWVMKAPRRGRREEGRTRRREVSEAGREGERECRVG